jgi:dTDP-4-amino-4,6-dideoxy-D-galactose acyltransferase
MTVTWALLPWDSEFFGARIARAEVPDLADEHLDEVDRSCRTNGIECVYLLADGHNEGDDARMARRGFRAVDVRVTLEAALSPGGSARSSGRPIRRATVEDIAALRAIAGGNHRGSRFYADPRLAARADELYAIWIEKSVRDPNQAVFVPVADGTPCGYITCESRDPVGRIGLFGVGAAVRGRGLGAALIELALEWFTHEGDSIARVVTQGRNESALRTYASRGFAVARRQWWYHRWVEPGT